jgi:hypothetical protein
MPTWVTLRGLFAKPYVIDLDHYSKMEPEFPYTRLTSGDSSIVVLESPEQILQLRQAALEAGRGPEPTDLE